MTKKKLGIDDGDSLIARIMEALSEEVVCAWCKYPNKKIRATGLCSHCYNINTRIRNAQKAVERFKIENPTVTGREPLKLFELKFLLKVEMMKAVRAKAEGSLYGNLYSADIDVVRVECELDLVSKRYVNKRLFSGNASLLGTVFSPLQLKYLFYMLSLMNREHLRRNREKEAYSGAATEQTREAVSE